MFQNPKKIVEIVDIVGGWAVYLSGVGIININQYQYQ